MRGNLRRAGKTWLSNVLRRFCERYSKELPTSLITRNDNQPYFYRYYVKQEDDDKPDQFGVFIHKFVGSDPLEEVHSHPWLWSVSIILSGGYAETKYRRVGEQKGTDGKTTFVTLADRIQKLFIPFEINIIEYDHMHRVDLLEGEPCWTLFFHGPRVSTWGFADEKTRAFREITRRTKDGQSGKPNQVQLVHGVNESARS